ncbi:MAG: DUF1792 domain-containing protein [Synergistaceae bacterium]|nr:DUF1792 domain-containing protein [Synergistaceae bacterium]
MKLYDNKTTVDLIVNQRKSLSRYGDGEFGVITGDKGIFFQKYSEEFQDDLIKAFTDTNPNLLIGLPHIMFDTSKCNWHTKLFWEVYSFYVLKKILPFIDLTKTYSSAFVARPFVSWHDKSSSKSGFENIKRIWDKREIVIVEGEHVKLGVGTDLFSNAKSIRRILCPSENAYEKIERIKESIRRNVEHNTIMLGVLGPTASILASQLCSEGYQFIDIGQLNGEYRAYIEYFSLKDSYVEGSEAAYSASVIDRID